MPAKGSEFSANSHVAKFRTKHIMAKWVGQVFCVKVTDQRLQSSCSWAVQHRSTKFGTKEQLIPD